MAITPSDFSKIWASNADTPEYTFAETDYLKGWDFVGNLPPTRAQWNAMQKSTDEKMKYVFDNFGAPLIAPTVADMTLQNRVYVYTGSETGYTAGHWYYWNGSWTDGGVYNSNTVQVDPTLTVSGAAADAKATGDAIKSTEAEMSLFGVDDLLWDNTNPSPTGGNGITITIDKTNKKITLFGTSTAPVVQNFYYNLSTMPAWLQKGKTYIAHCDTDADVDFQIREKVPSSTSSVLITSTRSHASFKVSDDATGMIIRLYISAGKTINTTVRPFISELPTLGELTDNVDARFKDLGSIPPSANFDTLTDIGYHFISISTAPPSESNPLPNTAAGLLCVFPTVNNIVIQIVFSNIGKNYFRRYYSLTSAWTEWVSFVDDTDYMKYSYFPTDTDLNDIKDTRFSFLSFGGNINYKNNPLDNASMGFLLSYKMQNIVTQVVMGINPAKQFIRRYNSTKNNWSNWENLTNKKSLKYLAVGNSGAQDMLSYVPWIMKNVAPDLDITIGITYSSGARIDQQIDFFDNDDPSLQLNLYRAGANNWVTYSGKTLKECLTFEDWDIISVQQASTYQMLWSYYTQIPDLINRIVTYVGTDHDNYVGHPVKIGYLAPQVRIASNTPDAQGKYQVIETPTTYSDYMDCVQRALDEYPLEFAIMSGTAVQTAREETTLDQYGNAEFNDGTSGHMNADYTHLQEGIGCMVASYASTLFLLDLAGINNRSVLGEGTRPDLQWVTDKNIPGKNPGTDTSVVGISDANCLIAQKCAIMAHKKPFEVSTIV